MKFYQVRRTIAADPARVWEVLSDADRLVAAGTGISRIEGRIAAGEKFTVWSEAVPGRGFATQVSEFVPPHSMVWTGGMPGGLFRGVRRFTLTATPDGTDLLMREEFTGLLLPLIWRTMPDLQPSFDTFAAGLAAASEENR